ncbi:MAG: hypothetical protein A2622_04835 [Bdellovibrionales bacterium RIFCSPHIGHO2_01_FULL_40_29]|nr:MAG: hypothetical protein A2622_04835 [Bdellovibrionales bacterium RIFCSPHIGHO2_01_FULL_40_29]OFZ34741.1 MAG: hypothetical protein A3D17_10535 [Bdellovibrionales bacterium RIFCSPHIGHO2_02_FULL_40_15]
MTRKIFLLFFGIFVLKCILGFFIPLVADEAYYHVWSLYPQLSYFDHPGMVSWLISFGRFLAPFQNPLSVRWPFIIAGMATLWIWICLIHETSASNETKLFFTGLYVLNPLLGLGSILATPDVPMLFFWTSSFFFFSKILKENSWWWYVLLGGSLGLGFCSKYHIVLFVLCGIVVLVVQKKLKSLRPSGVFLTILAGLITSTPVLLWNYQNDWASFAFQLKHGFGRTYYQMDWTVGYIIGQILLLSPFVFLTLFTRRSSSLSHQIFSWTQFLFFISSTFKSVVEANWPLAAHPHALVHFIQSATRRRIVWTFSYWVVIFISLISLLLMPHTRGLLKNQLLSSDVEEMGQIVKKYKPLYGPTYQISSLLTWTNQELIPKLKGFSRKDFFDEIPDSVPTNNTFYVLKEISSGWPESLTGAHFIKRESFDKLDLELYQVTYD